MAISVAISDTQVWLMSTKGHPPGAADYRTSTNICSRIRCKGIDTIPFDRAFDFEMKFSVGKESLAFEGGTCIQDLDYTLCCGLQRHPPPFYLQIRRFTY